MEDPHRETKYRPGPNPHWPVCHRFGPRFIINRHPRYSPGKSFASTHHGGSITDLITGHSVQLPTRVADIQTSATGGEVTERVSIQDRMGSANTESSPVDERTEWSRFRMGKGQRQTSPRGTTARHTNHKRGSITI